MKTLLLSLLLATTTTQAADLPPIDATLSYSSKLITRAGVTEERHYQERLVRRADTVWRERILPAAHVGNSHEAHSGHKDFDYESAAFWLSGSADRQTLRFVDRDDRVVVTVPAAEFETVGYDGAYLDAAALVDPKRVAQIPLSTRPSPVKGASWHEESKNGFYNRVLWLPSMQIALRVESGRDDGSVSRVTSVELLPSAAERPAPWLTAAAFEQKSYEDYLD
jgi:hypothetical protein